MTRAITLNIEDYVYQFYQIGATALNTSVEEVMERALFMYAGIIANDLNQETEHGNLNITSS